MIHPFTFFLVNTIQVIYNDVAQGPGSLPEATRDLSWMCCFLDAKGQEALAKDMETMEKLTDNPMAITKDVFRPLLKKVMKELHAEGYFIAAKMRPPTRESPMKELEFSVAEAKYGSK